MAYKFENITHYEAKIMISYLENAESGRTNKVQMRSIRQLVNKIDDHGKKSPHQADTIQDVLAYCLTDEERKKPFPQSELRAFLTQRQLERWDELFLKSLILENQEYETLKKTFEAIDQAGQFPRNRTESERVDQLLSKIEDAKPFELKDQNTPNGIIPNVPAVNSPNPNRLSLKKK